MVDLDRYEELRAVPPGRHVMLQRWRSLLFLHFRCDSAEIQALLPTGLTVDTFDGSAWVGFVPFLMEGVRPVGIPALPGLSAFPETNVRTYVHHNGTPGVWFFSLEAANAAACWFARRFFSLPYYFARMGVALDGDLITYEGFRANETAGYTATCKVGANLAAPVPGSLEFFLLERYLLFAVHRGRLCTGRVFHSPYPVKAAELCGADENLVAAAGIRPREFDHAIFSPGVDVRVYRLNELPL